MFCRHYPIILLLIAFACLLFGCGGKDAARVELERIDSLASNRQPKRALELLDSIDHRSLSESNQHLYDLLAIKARDKDFQMHRSNDVILRLVEYYRVHPEEGRMAEVLYYSGRVHFDMGDLPSALRYFQESLDWLDSGKDGENKQLRKLLYNQIADINNVMRQYSTALEYIENAIKIHVELNDTVGLIDALELKGALTLHSRRLNLSQATFNKSFALASKISKDSIKARQQMYLAAIEFVKNNNKKAIKIIRGVPERVDKNAHGSAMG